MIKRKCKQKIAEIMKTTQKGERARLDPDTTLASLTAQHLAEWLELLDYLRDTHAPTDEITYCRRQVTRLQQDLYLLRSN